MRRFCAAVLSLLLLCGCGGRPEPERALCKMLDALADFNIPKAQQKTLEGDLHIDHKTLRARQMYKGLFSSITYVVAGTEIEDRKAVVTVAITMIDMSDLIDQVGRDLLAEDLSGQSATSRRFFRLINTRIKEDDVAYATNTVLVTMTETDDGWKVDMDENSSFADAITGGESSLIS